MIGVALVERGDDDETSVVVRTYVCSQWRWWLVDERFPGPLLRFYVAQIGHVRTSLQREHQTTTMWFVPRHDGPMTDCRDLSRVRSSDQTNRTGVKIFEPFPSLMSPNLCWKLEFLLFIFLLKPGHTHRPKMRHQRLVSRSSRRLQEWIVHWCSFLPWLGWFVCENLL